MGFETFERDSFREGRGSLSSGVRLHGSQMWFTRAMTEVFLDDELKAMLLMVDRAKGRIRLVPTEEGARHAFRILYQVRNRHGRYTRSVINATALLRELGLPTQSCVIEEVDGGYEFSYKAS